MHQKLVSDPFLILGNNPKKSLNARNSSNDGWGILKDDSQKTNNQVRLMKKIMKSKRGLELVNSRSFLLWQIPLFAMYYLTKFDDVI